MPVLSLSLPLAPFRRPQGFGAVWLLAGIWGLKPWQDASLWPLRCSRTEPLTFSSPHAKQRRPNHLPCLSGDAGRCDGAKVGWAKSLVQNACATSSDVEQFMGTLSQVWRSAGPTSAKTTTATTRSNWNPCFAITQSSVGVGNITEARANEVPVSGLSFFLFCSKSHTMLYPGGD